MIADRDNTPVLSGLQAAHGLAMTAGLKRTSKNAQGPGASPRAPSRPDHRQLAQHHPNASLPDLAMSLNNLSLHLPSRRQREGSPSREHRSRRHPKPSTSDADWLQADGRTPGRIRPIAERHDLAS